MVVPPEDPNALAAAIRFLKENREEAGRLGDNGRRVAATKFDRKVVLQNFAQRLETLAGK
jgi:glycosyltransferase involved in cell wall biosynthesis